MKYIFYTLLALSLPALNAHASDFGPMFSDTSIVSLGADTSIASLGADTSMSDSDIEAMLNAFEPAAGGDDTVADTSNTTRVYAQPLNASPITVQIRPDQTTADN